MNFNFNYKPQLTRNSSKKKSAFLLKDAAKNIPGK